jgi:hypothetical protein
MVGALPFIKKEYYLDNTKAKPGQAQGKKERKKKQLATDDSGGSFLDGKP